MHAAMQAALARLQRRRRQLLWRHRAEVVCSHRARCDLRTDRQGAVRHATHRAHRASHGRRRSGVLLISPTAMSATLGTRSVAHNVKAWVLAALRGALST
jgi:hypothetical protein